MRQAQQNDLGRQYQGTCPITEGSRNLRVSFPCNHLSSKQRPALLCLHFLAAIKRYNWDPLHFFYHPGCHLQYMYVLYLSQFPNQLSCFLVKLKGHVG